MRLFNLYIQYNTHSTVVNPYVSKNNSIFSVDISKFLCYNELTAVFSRGPFLMLDGEVL